MKKTKHSASVPSSDHKIPASLGKPVKKLMSDLSGRKLSKRQAAQLATRMVTNPDAVPTAQRLGASTSEADLMILGAAAEIDSDSSPSARTPDQVVGTQECTLKDDKHVCKYLSDHSTIVYTVELLTSAAGNDQTEDTSPADGVPDYIQEWAKYADESWDYYTDTLKMQSTSDNITFEIHQLSSGSPCGSWPIAYVYCGPGVSRNSLDWLVPHEMFHQFQWPYIDSSLLTPDPSETPLDQFIDLLFSVYNINPWMESTANWATSHYADAKLPGYKTSSGSEVVFLPEFLADAPNGIVASHFLQGGTISGNAAYGAAPAVEFFAEQTNAATGEDNFVKQSFEQLNPSYLDGYSQIDAALSHYYYTLSDFITPLWLALDTMCDDNPDSPWWILKGRIVDNWCSRTSPDPRPSHIDASIGEPDDATFQIRAGGAKFVDFDVETDLGSFGSTLTLTFGSSVSVYDEVTVWAWKGAPGGEVCDTDQIFYADNILEVNIPADCSHATLAIVNHGSDLRGATDAYHVSWAGHSSGAVISDGDVSLGVNADGSLGLGTPGQIFCRKAVARDVSYLTPPGKGLVDEASGFDAIRDAWHRPCQTTDYAEGWSVYHPDYLMWGKPAFGYQATLRPDIVSFTHTSSTATSTVRLDDDYEMIQHWAPSSQARVYKLTVTIVPDGVVDPSPLTYRRVLPLEADADGLEYDDTGYTATISQGSDNVSDATNDMFWIDDEEGPYHGSIDDPTTPLPHYDWSTATVNGWWGLPLGFAADITVDAHDNTAGDPQFALYYGFASSVSSANSKLSDLNTTTRAVITVPTTDSGTHVILVGYRDLD